ncbi:hypothetical protein [Streptomyces sp. NBC_01518]
MAAQKSRASAAPTFDPYAADPRERELAHQAIYGAFLKKAQG